MTTRRALTMAEIEEMLQDSDAEEATNVVYVPPQTVDAVTDEENLDKDEILNDANINMLAEIAGEVIIEYNSCTEDFDLPAEAQETLDDSTEDEEYTQPLASLVSKSRRTGRKSLSKAHSTQLNKKKKDYPASKYTLLKNFGKPVWAKYNDPKYTRPAPDPSPLNMVQDELAATLGGKSPTELFELFFGDDILQLISDYTNLYANQNNVTEKICCVVDIKRFIGILILSGYHTLPEVNNYWSTSPDMGIPIVKQAMSRSKFKTIKKYLHLSDNTKLDTTDRFAKIRPLLDAMNKKYMQFGIFTSALSIDEQMVPYFGRHSCKMFIRGKPIRFGFKYWCLCSSDGYMFFFITISLSQLLATMILLCQ